ncbi:restriction endonuclease subunit S [SAR86 cluster bacterium]|nr:restriction endonuclease subunit S [SAR86 cluster bacterium]
MSWNISKLGEECEIFSGNSINAKTKESLYTNVEGIPYIATKDIDYDGKINYLNGISIPEEDQKKYKKAKSECVFICAEGGSAGRKIAFSDTECFFVNKLFCLESGSNLVPKYVYYYLKSEAFQIQFKNALAGLIGGVSLTKIKLFDITYPSLLEQKQIVEKLDAAFADIDKVISATEKNIENAQSILKSYINEIIKYNDDTEVIELGTVIDTLTDYHANGSYKILKKHVALKDDEDYAWMVRSTDFENNFQNDKKYITKSAYDFLKKSKILGGELLMSKIGNAGKIYLMPKHNKPASLAMNMFLIRCDESTALNEYIFFCLSSYFGNQQINDRLKGAATLTITKDSVRSIEIPLISIAEQRITISKINAIRKKACAIEEIYRMKFKNLSALKLSILSHAFQDELTKDSA